MKAVRGTRFEITVRSQMHGHPLVDDFVQRYGVEREYAQRVVTESVLDAMDLLGSVYVMRMARIVRRMTQLREAIHLVYERVLSGTTEGIDSGDLNGAFTELHAATRELADAKRWAEREGAAVAPLPTVPHTSPPAPAELRPAEPAPAKKAAARKRRPEPQYPGARTGVAEAPTRAPRPEQPIAGKSGSKWREEVKRVGDITLELDVEGLYWKFPELEDGVVLHFPDFGYRAWKDPVSGAIVEELLAGRSVTKARRFTRGEDVLFSAADVSEAYRNAKSERAHGAGAPGIGFDAPYGVAHAVRRINQYLENHGVERWVRTLRDNAEPGVEYLWTTRTKKTRQTLASREYTISAVVDGQIHELYVFETTVPPDAPIGEAPVTFELIGVSPAAELYGAPVTLDSQAALDAAVARGVKPEELPRIERVEPPSAVVEALGRTRQQTREAARPAVVRAAKRLQKLAGLLDSKLLKHALGTENAELVEAMGVLTDAIQDVQHELTTTAPDAARIARYDAAIAAFTQRAARWTDHVTAADVRSLARQLQALRRQ